MKKVIEMDTTMNPHLHDLHQLVSQAIEKTITKEITISALSYDAVMKRIGAGKLPLQGMETDMKIQGSKFYHFYGEGAAETIIQFHSNKMAVFSDESP